MVRKNSVPSERLLTPVELELISILWRQGPSTVHDVQTALKPTRNLAYTSISTVLRILESKRFLKSEKSGRGHKYSPLVSKDEYESITLRDVVGRVFDGTPTSLVRRLLEIGDLTPRDLSEIQSILDEKRG